MGEQKPSIALGGDIWHIVITLLLGESRVSLQSLRLTSKTCKAWVDPVLYRCLELSDEDTKFDSTRYNIQRLLNPSDDLSTHIRHLVVSNNKRAYTNYWMLSEVSDQYRPGDLESVIGRLHLLQSFR
ncbi:MAG: hypothetical protein Q9224_002866 [Gallowayella concinna]